MAHELTAGIDFVAVGIRIAEKYLKGLEKKKLSEVSLGKKTITDNQQAQINAYERDEQESGGELRSPQNNNGVQQKMDCTDVKKQGKQRKETKFK